jgi:hypothetical protein
MAVRIFDFLYDHWMRLNPKTRLAIAMTVLIAGLIYAGWLEGTAPSGMYY